MHFLMKRKYRSESYLKINNKYMKFDSVIKNLVIYLKKYIVESTYLLLRTGIINLIKTLTNSDWRDGGMKKAIIGAFESSSVIIIQNVGGVPL